MSTICGACGKTWSGDPPDPEGDDIGAPSFEAFGAYFPAWLLCGLIGILGAIIARVVLVNTQLATVLPYQLGVCLAIGTIAAILVWLTLFGW